MKSAERLQSAVFERDDAVEAAREIEVVGGDQRREPVMADEVDKRAHHAVARCMVQISGGFIREPVVHRQVEGVSRVEMKCGCRKLSGVGGAVGGRELVTVKEG